MEITPELIIENAERHVFLTEGRTYIGTAYLYPVNRMMREQIDVVFDGFAFDLLFGGSYLSMGIRGAHDEKSLLGVLCKRRIFSDEELEKLFNRIRQDHAIITSQERIIREKLEAVLVEDLWNRADQFFVETRLSWFPIGYVPLRDAVEVSHPTADNNLLEIVRKVSPELRAKHRIYQKFLVSLSPSIARIPYNKTMVGADKPLIFWLIGEFYLSVREYAKKMLWRISKGRIFLQNKRSYVRFDEWFRTDEKWQEYFRNLLLGENSLCRNYIDQDFVRKLFMEQITGKKDNSIKLLHIATFELFLRQFFADR